jgi:hypothetical protein
MKALSKDIYTKCLEHIDQKDSLKGPKNCSLWYQVWTAW